MTTSQIERWVDKYGLQDLQTDLEYILERYYKNMAMFDDRVHSDAAKDLMELLITYWTELGNNEVNIS